MGFFDNNLTEGAGYSATVDFMNLIEDASIPVLAENASYNQLALEAVAQSEENWGAIMKECAFMELTHFQENGTEYVYTEATGSGFIASAKAFFAKIWEKIKSLFKKFAVAIGALTNGGKDFVTKYRTDIASAIKNIPSEAKIKGYKYTLEWAATTFANAEVKLVEKLNTAKTNTSTGSDTDHTNDGYDYEDEMEGVRGLILLGTDTKKFSASEFSSELHDKLRNGESSAIEIDLNAGLVNTAMSELQSAAEVKKKTNKAYNDMNKYFGQIEKALNKHQTELSKGFPKGTGDDANKAGNLMIELQRNVSLNRGGANALQVAHSAFLTAAKEHVAQCKHICVKVVTYKTKHEGYSFSHYDGNAGTGFLENVKLK